MVKSSIFVLALIAGAGPLAADAVCTLELQEGPEPHLTATLTKTADAAEIEYGPQADFLYPFTFDCDPPGTRLCVTDNTWSLHAMSFEYLPYAMTLSVLDREAFGTAETDINLKLWKIVDCVGELGY